MNHPLRIGIIGTGFITGTAHIPAIQRLGGRATLCALADSRPDALAYMAKRYGIEKTYTDPLEMLRENTLDLVHVCTANNTHKQFAIAALRSGAHVLCEKPLALTLQDAMDMFAEADKAGKLLIACQNNRMGPMQEVKKLIESGLLGDVYFAEIENLRRRGVPTWGCFHTQADNGGGPLCDVGVHYLDATLFALGNPKLVNASASVFQKIAPLSDANSDTLGAMTGDQPYLPRGDYDYRDFSVEDFATGIVRFEGGLLMQLKFSWALNLPRADKYHLAGTKGGLVYNKSGGLQNPISVYSTQGKHPCNGEMEIAAARKGAMPDIGHTLLIKHLADVLQHEEACLIQREEMLNVVAVMEAFYTSARLGREVSAKELGIE